jgi:hypothetical protein
MPDHTFSIDALTSDDPFEPTSAVQWSVVDGGDRKIYGDQSWVKDGRVLRLHPDGHLERRTITVTYGPWEAVDANA